MIRARYLDNELSYCYRTGLKDITLLVSEFRVLNWKVQSVIIAEDKVNFLTFPSVKNTIIIWGHDCGVAKLKNISFLQNAQFYYWGDLGAQGFEILSQFRGYFPQT